MPRLSKLYLELLEAELLSYTYQRFDTGGISMRDPRSMAVEAVLFNKSKVLETHPDYALLKKAASQDIFRFISLAGDILSIPRLQEAEKDFGFTHAERRKRAHESFRLLQNWLNELKKGAK